ncbi:hypothetical protein [Streptomyces gibsoniae]|uniref:Uncharacterized protein n=1 Tax=Streptomyces gibsoniae TaxID=3075529 RepID=A0ABU2TYW8_9ACTN|nr:hypothetical protein [Streptomyces sp. DSM 41699]MDT0466021.1 hypothetical protein [Streptomyces sp. DSM 41699]
MRKWIAGALGAAVVVGAALPAAALNAETGLTYHGYVTMGRGEVNVRLTPWNKGMSRVEDATVRLRWSKALADEQMLPGGCARYDASTVLCRTGAVLPMGEGREIHLRVHLADTSTDEVRMEIDSLWGGGAADRNPASQQVLALGTGDRYSF